MIGDLSKQVSHDRKELTPTMSEPRKQFVIKKSSRMRTDSKLSTNMSVELIVENKNGNAFTPNPIKPKIDIQKAREESKQKIQNGARQLISPQKRSKTVKLHKGGLSSGSTSKSDIENSIDWILYRKKHCLDKKVKIFICWGYASFKKALLQRGWHENTDFNSNVFHLKFAVKKDDIYKMRNMDDFETGPLYDF